MTMSAPSMRFLMTLACCGICASPLPKPAEYPNASSRHLTDAIACAVGQTPQILWVMMTASLGFLFCMMSSKPRHMVPLDKTPVAALALLVSTSIPKCPSILVIGSITTCAIYLTPPFLSYVMERRHSVRESILCATLARRSSTNTPVHAYLTSSW